MNFHPTNWRIEPYLAKVPGLHSRCKLGKDETNALFPGGRGRGEMLKRRQTRGFSFTYYTPQTLECSKPEMSNSNRRKVMERTLKIKTRDHTSFPRAVK